MSKSDIERLKSSLGNIDDLEKVKRNISLWCDEHGISGKDKDNLISDCIDLMIHNKIEFVKKVTLRKPRPLKCPLCD